MIASTLAIMGELLHLLQHREAWAAFPPQCTECNNPPIKDKYINFTLSAIMA